MPDLGCRLAIANCVEARQQIRRAIECRAEFGHASQAWPASWDNLAEIETDAGNAAAAEAKGKAIACYPACRRDGGENHYRPGRLSFASSSCQVLGGGQAEEQ